MGSTSVISTILGLAMGYVYLENLGNRRLDKFPGPLLAKWTYLYKMYYDVVKKGAWVEHLQELHQVYGPIVRVGPNELHFASLDAYHEIYAVGSKFSKDARTYNPVSANHHVFAMVDPHDAMVRRAIVLPYFSRRSMLDREWIIQEKVDEFVEMLINTHTKDKSSFSLQETLRVYLGGIPPSVCFPDMKQCMGLTSSNLLPRVTDIPPGVVPWLLLKNLPSKVIQSLQHFANTRDIRIGQYSRMDELHAYGVLVDDAMNTPLSDIEERNENMCHSLLKRSEDNRPEPTRRWLMAETLNVKYAGIDTTSTAAFVTIRAVLGDDGVRRKLVQELNDVWPDLGGMAPGVLVLEKLLFLTAVIKEGIRLSIGIFSPMNRVVGPEDAVISGISIPAGTIVGMTNAVVQLNPDIFPEPHAFKPERWIQKDSQKLEKYFVAFARGPRSCIGIHLAWAMLYLTVANLFRRLDLSPVSMDDLHAPFRMRDEFVSVFVGKPVYEMMKGNKFIIGLYLEILETLSEAMTLIIKHGDDPFYERTGTVNSLPPTIPSPFRSFRCHARFLVVTTIHSCLAFKITIPVPALGLTGPLTANWTREQDDPTNVDLILFNPNGSGNATVTVLTSIDNSNTTSGSLPLHLPGSDGQYQVLAVPSNFSLQGDVNLKDEVVGISYVLSVSMETETQSSTSSTTSTLIPTFTREKTMLVSIVSTSGIIEPTTTTQEHPIQSTTEVVSPVTAAETTEPVPSKHEVAIVSAPETLGSTVIFAESTGIPTSDGDTTAQGSQTTAAGVVISPPDGRSTITSGSQKSSGHTGLRPTTLVITTITSPTTHTPVGTSADGGPTSTSQDVSGSKKSTISTPAIAGIAISSAALVLVFAAVLWRVLLLRSRTRYGYLRNTGDEPQAGMDAEKTSQQTGKKRNGPAWKRISPFPLLATRGGTRSKTQRGSMYKHLDFDSEVLAAPRRSPLSRVHPEELQRYSDAIMSPVRDMEEDEIPDEDFRTIVNNSGVALAPRPLPRLDINVPRFGMIEIDVGTAHDNDEVTPNSPHDPDSAILESFYTRYHGLHSPIPPGSPLTGMVMGSPYVLTQAGHDRLDNRTYDLGRSLSLLPSSFSPTENERRLQQERELADLMESEWAMPYFREPTHYEDPPDYAETIASPRGY
ncbi:hypothetical protein V5O48_004084 [Marasmius crinis-equi]|uniref:Cytochrome P450 n=1 Tax=Marasmius crinis-equi TaxID=585013 RepID=A0ABR3FR45_9AGAR